MKLEQKPVSSFHGDWSKNCGIGLLQIRHQDTWQRTKWSYFSSLCPRIPWRMLCQAGDEPRRITKGRVYINSEKGRVSLLAQYRNKECCKYFCASFISVNSSCFHVWLVLCLSPISWDYFRRLLIHPQETQRRNKYRPINGTYILSLIPVSSKQFCGPGSSVGIATNYGLDGPGIESRWGRDFPHLFRPVLGPTQPSVQWVPGFSRG